MGIGVGGDYPLSAIISSEFSNIEHRGRLMCAVFAAQGWGNLSTASLLSPEIFTDNCGLAAAVVALVVVKAYKHPLLEHDTVTDLQHVD